MKFDFKSSYEYVVFSVIALIFLFASLIVILSFFQNRQVNTLIDNCIVETGNHLACKDLYKR